MRLKICGITQPEEVEVLAHQAVDLMGLWFGIPGGPRDLSADQVIDLAHQTREIGGAEPMLVTFMRDPAVLSRVMGEAGIGWIQLHGFQPPSLVKALRQATPPGTRIVKVLHIQGKDCLEGALIGAYEAAGVDTFLLDAVAEDGRLGSTGQTLDPGAVLALAEALSKPFFLAGGLSAENRPRFERVVAHPLFHGIDVDGKARNDSDRIDAAPVAALSRAWREEGGRGAFIESLLASSVRVIAEVKAKAADGTDLFHGRAPADIARAYQSVGAPCLSVVTGAWFGGTEAMLDEVLAETSLPVLQKDFITRADQIRRAAERGVSAILLTAKLLPGAALPKLVDAALEAGLTPFVEVSTEREIASLTLGPRGVLAVNNKDIETRERGEAAFQRSLALLPLIAGTGSVCPVSASGMDRPADAARMLAAGYAGLLVGTGLLKAPSIGTWFDLLEREEGALDGATFRRSAPALGEARP